MSNCAVNLAAVQRNIKLELRRDASQRWCIFGENMYHFYGDALLNEDKWRARCVVRMQKSNRYKYEKWSIKYRTLRYVYLMISDLIRFTSGKSSLLQTFPTLRTFPAPSIHLIFCKLIQFKFHFNELKITHFSTRSIPVNRRFLNYFRVSRHT